MHFLSEIFLPLSEELIQVYSFYYLFTMEEKATELLKLLGKTLQDLTGEVTELRRSGQKQVIYSNIQTAELLGITTATLKKWRELGLISFSRVDNTFLYTPDDIRDFLKKTHYTTRASKRIISKMEPKEETLEDLIFERITEPITTIASAVYSPILSDFCGFVPSLPLTKNVPTIEEMIPRAESIAGKITAPFSIRTVLLFAHAKPSVIAEISEPLFQS